jgi:hypothetical protein
MIFCLRVDRCEDEGGEEGVEPFKKDENFGDWYSDVSWVFNSIAGCSAFFLELQGRRVGINEVGIRGGLVWCGVVWCCSSWCEER